MNLRTEGGSPPLDFTDIDLGPQDLHLESGQNRCTHWNPFKVLERLGVSRVDILPLLVSILLPVYLI